MAPTAYSSSNIFIWHFETLNKAIGYVELFHHGHETPSQEVICHSAVPTTRDVLLKCKIQSWLWTGDLLPTARLLASIICLLLAWCSLHLRNVATRGQGDRH